MSNDVLLNIDAGVATVTLNRPNMYNAFDDQVIRQLSSVFQEVDANDDARLMILAAEGKNFCSGGDLNWMKRMVNYSSEENVADARALADMLRTLNSLSKPTIARVQGVAYGGAVGLVSCCDMAFAASNARFCLSEVKIGLYPATISPYVIAAIGQRAARRYFLTAEVFDASKAQQLGLVSEALELEDLDAEIAKISTAILANGPNAVASSKQLIFDVANKPIDDALVADTAAWIAAIRASEEGQEGLAAFLEKRKPAWNQTS